MKRKIICILLMTLLITTTLPVVGKMTNNDGSIESGKKTMPNLPILLEPNPSRQSYKVAVINAGFSPDVVQTQLQSWGYTADLIDIPTITLPLLWNYHIVWINAGASMNIDNAGKAPEIRDYVDQGGGMIFGQPSPNTLPYIPACLPYTWEIIDYQYGSNPCATTIVDPAHPLTQGLTIHDMPDCYETMGAIAPEYKILARSGDGEPGFACTEYGNGKIILQMDASLGPPADVCGDPTALSQDMVTRMIGWARKEKSVDLPVVVTVNRPILQFLQNHPNLFLLLQKLIQRFGL